MIYRGQESKPFEPHNPESDSQNHYTGHPLKEAHFSTQFFRTLWVIGAVCFMVLIAVSAWLSGAMTMGSILIDLLMLSPFIAMGIKLIWKLAR